MVHLTIPNPMTSAPRGAKTSSAYASTGAPATRLNERAGTPAKQRATTSAVVLLMLSLLLGLSVLPLGEPGTVRCSLETV